MDRRDRDFLDDRKAPHGSGFGRPSTRHDASQDRRGTLFADLDERIAGIEQAIDEARRAPSRDARRDAPEAAAQWRLARARAEDTAAALLDPDLGRSMARVERAIEAATGAPYPPGRREAPDASPPSRIGLARLEEMAAALLKADLDRTMAQVGRTIETATGAVSSPGRREAPDAPPSRIGLSRLEDKAAALLKADLERAMAQVERAIETSACAPGPPRRREEPGAAPLPGFGLGRLEDTAAALLKADLDRAMEQVERAIEEASPARFSDAPRKRPDATPPRAGIERARAEDKAAALLKSNLDRTMAQVEQAIEEASRASVFEVPRDRPDAAPSRPGIEPGRAEEAAAALLQADLGRRMARVELAIEEISRAPVFEVPRDRSDAAPSRPGREPARAEDAATLLQADLGRRMARVEQAIEEAGRAPVFDVPRDRPDAAPSRPGSEPARAEAAATLLQADLGRRMARVEQAIEEAGRTPVFEVPRDRPDAAPSRPGSETARAEAAAAALLQADLGRRMARVEQAIEEAGRALVFEVPRDRPDIAPSRPGIEPARAEDAAATLPQADLANGMARASGPSRAPVSDAPENGLDATPRPAIERARAEDAAATLLQVELGKSLARVRQAIDTARRAPVSDARQDGPQATRPDPGPGRAEERAAAAFKAELGSIRQAFEQVAGQLGAIEKISGLAAPVIAPLLAGPRPAERRPDVDAVTSMPAALIDVMRGRHPDSGNEPAAPGPASADLNTERPSGATQSSGAPKPATHERAVDAQRAAWEAAGAAKLSAALNHMRVPNGHAQADARGPLAFDRQPAWVSRLRLAYAGPMIAALMILVAGAVATKVLSPGDHVGRLVAQSSRDGDRDPGPMAGAVANRGADWPDTVPSANLGDVAAPVASAPVTLDYEPTGSAARIETLTENQAVVPSGLERSAESGDTGAQVELASRYANGTAKNDLAAAAYWYERAAQQGDATAQYRLGFVQENGIGVPRSIGKALRWYKQAARGGNPLAMNELGMLALTDSPPDYGRASGWFQNAAERGVADSQYHLGLLLADGLGLPKSPTDAYRWFDIAARNGQRDAEAARDEMADRLAPRDLAAAHAAAAAFRPRPAARPSARTVTGEADADAARHAAGAPLQPPPDP